MTVINYIIPIKKPALIVDRPAFRKLLERTLKSIEAQAGEKRILIAASEGTPLPKLPASAEFVEVGDTGVDTSAATSRAAYYDLVRQDKGQRVRAAINLVQGNRDYVMVVDDDDILHRGLAAFVFANPASGYVITKGFMHNVDTGALFRMDDFNLSCGTSVITYRGLYRYRQKHTGTQLAHGIKELGSHVILPAKMKAKGWPVIEVPFRAAIYCTGNRNATQRSIREKFGETRTAEFTRARDVHAVTPEERAEIRREFGLSPRKGRQTA